MIPISAEPIFTLAGFTITNTLINTTVAMLILVAFAYTIKSNIKAIPSRLQAFMETLLELMLDYGDRVTQDRKKTLKFLPIAGTSFIFILVSNWLGLFPGTGTIGIYKLIHGEIELVPILRSANSDLNLTLALAVSSVLFTHIVGMMSVGIIGHWSRFIQIGNVWKAIKSLSPIKVLIALVEFGVGFIELFSEAAKILSLSLRLFGNIFAGEVLLTVFASLMAFILPTPFLFMELMVGAVQATVFSILIMVYLTIMSTSHGEEHLPKHT